MLKVRNHLVTHKNSVSAGTNTRKYITVHETDNTRSGANADAHARLQAGGNSRQASWHWQVDDKEAVKSFNHTAICWHSGATGNKQSIAIEICVNSDGDYSKAVRNAAKLAAKIMKEENIPLSNVVQHNKWTGKNCPRNLRSGAKGANWTGFKSLVEAELSAGSTENDTDKEVDELAQPLLPTQKRDFKKLLQKAFEIGMFTVDHTDKVDTMTRGEALDLLISYYSRKETDDNFKDK